MLNISEETWNVIVDFFNQPLFVVLGGVFTLTTFVFFIYTGWLIFKGVLPVLYRIGVGLARRKIAIFSHTEYTSLENMLVDSRLFNKNNIQQVHASDLKKVSEDNIYLVHWKDFKGQLDDILRMKKDSTALIVYAPQNEGLIDRDVLEKINKERNTIIVNFRGRLLNDILMSLITISYAQK